MENTQRKAVVIRLMRSLTGAGSWCGETHVQKAVFLLQSLTDVPTEFEYILYKHGPFSFALRDELATMRAASLVQLVIRSPEYGPAIVPTENAERLEAAASAALAQVNGRIAFVARAVGNKGVAELERLATAIFVATGSLKGGGMEAVCRALRELKPHISGSDAMAAVGEAENLIKLAPRCG